MATRGTDPVPDPLARAAWLLLALIVALATADCADTTAVAMKATERDAVRTVGVNPAVKVPGEIYYLDHAQGLGMGIGGAVGGLIASSGGADGQIVDALASNAISVGAIVRTEFVAASATVGDIAFVDSTAAHVAELTLVVNLYGLSYASPLDAALYPMLSVTATIRRADGNVVWQKTAAATVLTADNKLGYSFSQYIQDPERLRAVFANAAAIVSRVLVADLRGGPGA